MKSAITAAVLVAALASLGWAQHGHPPTAGAAGAQHHDEMLRRGEAAMGFDQHRTVHTFLLYQDGGAIQVAVKDHADRKTLDAVRAHLQEISRLFKAGDFRKPAQTHAREVPGTAEMTRRAEHIDYRFEEIPSGGRVNIVTRDASALAAVHAFLRYQIEDHRTGDTGRVMIR